LRSRKSSREGQVGFDVFHIKSLQVLSGVTLAQGLPGYFVEQAYFSFCTPLPTMRVGTAGWFNGAVGTGSGSELRRPLGYTIVGGLLLSQILTL
jgi:hypothetical protein